MTRPTCPVSRGRGDPVGILAVQARAVGRHQQGTIAGLRQIGQRLTSILIPPLMGGIADRWGASESFVTRRILAAVVRTARADHPPRRALPSDAEGRAQAGRLTFTASRTEVGARLNEAGRATKNHCLGSHCARLPPHRKHCCPCRRPPPGSPPRLAPSAGLVVV